MNERPISSVPGVVLGVLGLALAAQLAWHGARPGPSARARDLPPPPPLELLSVSSLGARSVAARLLMIWLQAWDNQSGVSVPFSRLDYARVQAWLGRSLELDPRTGYPLLSASRVYAAVPIEAKKRAMLDWVHARFLEDPDRRWPWLAHAAITAKHQLQDLPLALRYARSMTEHATGPEVPGWARDMTIIVLEDMGELAAARIVLGGLLDSGRVTDPHELRFLLNKLEELEAASVARESDG